MKRPVFKFLQRGVAVQDPQKNLPVVIFAVLLGCYCYADSVSLPGVGPVGNVDVCIWSTHILLTEIIFSWQFCLFWCQNVCLRELIRFAKYGCPVGIKRKQWLITNICLNCIIFINLTFRMFIKVMQFKQMFVTAVCVLFLLKLKWPKSKNFYGCPCSIPIHSL